MTTREATKKGDERRLLREFFWLLSEQESGWEILDDVRERPDFIARGPDGADMGVELTQLLTPYQGAEQHQDGRVCKAIREVVLPAVQEMGGLGGFVIGFNSSLPAPTESLDGFLASLRARVDAGKPAFRVQGGQIPGDFKHPWGVIQCIARADEFPGEVVLSGQPGPLVPAYKRGRSRVELEAALVECVRGKALRAHGYAVDRPLWLAIRNPNQRISDVSSACRASVEAAAGGRFARITLFNLPLGVHDLRPPQPRCLELLANSAI